MESFETAHAYLGRQEWPILLEWIERNYWQSDEVFGSRLAGWRGLFERIPAETLTRMPALALHPLRLLSGTDPAKALEALAAAWGRAGLADDALLRCEYAALAVTCLGLLGQDTEGAAGWAARLAADRALLRGYPTPEAELRIAGASLVAMLITGGGTDQHDRKEQLEARCVALLKGRLQPGVRAAGLDALLHSATMGHEVRLMTWTLRQVERAPVLPWLAPRQRARHIDSVSGAYSLLRDFAAHRRVLDEGIARALAEGDIGSAKMFMFGLAGGALVRNEADAAATAMARYEPYLDPASPNDQSMAAGNRAILATLRGRWEEAEANGRTAAGYAELAGLPAYELGAFVTLHASALMNVQRPAEAAQVYERSASIVPGEMKDVARANLELALAFADEAAAGPARTAERVARTFTGLAPEFFRALFGFCRADRALARAVHLAILGGVPAETLRTTVVYRNLVPPPDAGEAWPWAARVRLLGGFDVEGLGPDPAASRRAANKPIELLQFLGAFAPQAVATERVADALWPDADADLALNNLDVTLVRLRKRAGRDDIVVRRAGRLALGTHAVWVDCAELAALAAGSEAGVTAARRALVLYRGPLLPDLEAPWVAARRSTPARQAMQVLERSLAALLGAGGILDAAGIVDALVDTDLPAETLVLSAFERTALAAPQRLAQAVPPLVSAVESGSLGAPARKLRAFAARRGIDV